MPKHDVPLTLQTIGGGTLERDFQRHLAQVVDAMADDDLAGEKWKITINVELTEGTHDGAVRTLHTVKSTHPVKQRKGVAWHDGEALVTDAACIDSNQMDIVHLAEAKARA